jgi:VanZ family protein
MRARWLAPLLWAILIETLTSWPNPPSFSAPAGSDKVVHVGLYAVFAFLVVRAAQPGLPAWRTLAVVLLVVSAWAAVDEWHQRFIAGRGAEIADWGADVAGAMAGLALRRFRSRRTPVRFA